MMQTLEEQRYRLILQFQTLRAYCVEFTRHSWFVKGMARGVLSIMLLALVWILVRRKSVVEAFLFNNNLVSGPADSTPERLGALSTFFITAGASVVGIIAIAFSLSMFSLQQAADKHTPKILREFLSDRIIRNIYWELVIIALSLFLFPFVFPRDYALYAMVLALLLLWRSFLLLRKQYFHTARMIDPRFLMGLEHNRAIELLQDIDHHLDRLIRAGAIRPGRGNNRQDS